MSVTAPHLVGREEELGAIVELLDDSEQLPAVVVLAGEAGIGKTTLWAAGIEAAAERGYQVLSCRPSEAETRYSFAGLTDLLGDEADEIIAELPPIQQRALGAALLRGDSYDEVDERVIAAAFLGALRLLANDRPLCVTADDVQWLDAASLAALRYALARLDGPIAALIAVRGDVPAWVRRAVPEEQLRRVEVGGLSVGAIYELLHTRLDVTFSRPTLLRLWEASGGNPFFALELAGALQRRGGTLAPGEELPIPADLDELLRERLDGLGAPAFEVAQVVAALADPAAPLVEAAVGRRFDSGLAEALTARILELDGERLRFTHPLLGSAVTSRQTPGRRRSLHARLATITPTEEERARHLALATAKPNAEIADNLETAAQGAHARGAPAAAAELAEQALRLTPATEPDRARRRLIAAAELHGRAGDTERAVALLEQARAAATAGVERAAILAQLSELELHPQAAIALCRQALAAAKEDDALQARIQLRLAHLMRWDEGVERGLEYAELAVRSSSRTDDVALRCRTLAAHGVMHFHAARGIPYAEMEDAIALERSLAEWPLVDGPTITFGYQLWWAADVDRARVVLEEVRRAAKAQDDPARAAEALWDLSLLEWRAGNWAKAELHAEESLELKTQLGCVMPPHELPTAVLDAHRGRVEDARARARRAIDLAQADGIRIAQSGHGWVLGFIELSLGNPAAALEQLRRSNELREQFQRDPGMRIGLGDLLEALIAVGELDEAAELLATSQERAEALDREWALAILARCRGLLLAARGDFAGGFASFELALAEHARGSDPFQRARTLLALGRTQRRAKRRGDARRTLEDALARFESLGAPLWADQTRAELARIGGRAPSNGELTEGERRVASLVAEGRTNREVAAALFLGERTVETHLTHVYRKLGIRSRAELARLLAAKPGAG